MGVGCVDEDNTVVMETNTLEVLLLTRITRKWEKKKSRIININKNMTSGLYSRDTQACKFSYYTHNLLQLLYA